MLFSDIFYLDMLITQLTTFLPRQDGERFGRLLPVQNFDDALDFFFNKGSDEKPLVINFTKISSIKRLVLSLTATST
jgi:hypothetical protein